MRNSFSGMMLCLVLTGTGFAKEITVSAEYSPTVAEPTRNTFKNTTPVSGYCVKYADKCKSNDLFSTQLGGIESSPVTEIMKDDRVSFNIPSAAWDVIITNTSTGNQQRVKFAIDGIGARILGFGGDTAGVSRNWDDDWYNAPAGCYDGTFLLTGNINWGSWFWRWPKSSDSTVCTRTSTANRGRYPSIFDTNFLYTLDMPNPLVMDTGIYEGELVFSVAGTGADINLGGVKYKTNDSILLIKFVLKVTHAFSIKSLQSSTLMLYACNPKKVCTEAENKANWDRSTISNIIPTLTAKSDFEITSSGSFTTYLRCEFNSGESCGLKSAKTGEIVPVQTYLTLPGNILSPSGATINNLLMKNSKDIHHAFFTTAAYSRSGKGGFYFEVEKESVALMKNNSPDEYDGVITVIFDQDVW